MFFRVAKFFYDVDGTPKNPGDFIEANTDRAAKLRRYGNIGSRIYPAIPEKAVAPPPERSPAPEAERAVAPGPEETAARFLAAGPARSPRSSACR